MKGQYYNKKESENQGEHHEYHFLFDLQNRIKDISRLMQYITKINAE